MPDPNGQDSWESVVATATDNMRLAALSHNPPHARAEIKRLQNLLTAANTRIKELEEQLCNMALRINSLERASFTGMN